MDCGEGSLPLPMAALYVSVNGMVVRQGGEGVGATVGVVVMVGAGVSVGDDVCIGVGVAVAPPTVGLCPAMPVCVANRFWPSRPPLWLLGLSPLANASNTPLTAINTSSTITPKLSANARVEREPSPRHGVRGAPGGGALRPKPPQTPDEPNPPGSSSDEL